MVPSAIKLLVRLGGNYVDESQRRDPRCPITRVGTAGHWVRRFGIEEFHASPVWDAVCKVIDDISDSHDALCISEYKEIVAMGFYFFFCELTGGLHYARTPWAQNPGEEAGRREETGHKGQGKR